MLVLQQLLRAQCSSIELRETLEPCSRIKPRFEWDQVNALFALKTQRSSLSYELDCGIFSGSLSKYKSTQYDFSCTHSDVSQLCSNEIVISNI